MIWSIIYFILGCALLAEIIYCIVKANSTSSNYAYMLTRPFGINVGTWPGAFLRIFLCVVMVVLFYVACRDFLSAI